MAGLTEEDVFMFLRDMLGVTITREQLQVPNRDVMCQILIPFLCEFGVENVNQPDLVATSNFDSVERYEEFIMLANIQRGISYLLSAIGSNIQFTMADIIQPKRKRIMKILSMLILLWTRLTNIQHSWTEIEAQNQELPERRKQVELELKELKKKIEEKSLFRSNNQHKFEDNERAFCNFKKEYDEAMNSNNQLTERMNMVKKNVCKLKDVISEKNFEIAQLNEEMTHLEEKIVKSPEKIQAEMDVKEKEVDDHVQVKRRLEQEYLDELRTIDGINKSIQVMNPICESFNEALKQIENIRNEVNALNDMKMKIKGTDNKIKELNIRLKEQQQNLDDLNKQKQSIELQFKKQHKRAMEFNQNLKKAVEENIEKQSLEEKKELQAKMQLEQQLSELNFKINTFMQREEQLKKNVELKIRQHSTTFVDSLKKKQEQKENFLAKESVAS